MSWRRSRCRWSLIAGTVVSIVGCTKADPGSGGQTTAAVPLAAAQMPPAPTFGAPETADRAAVVQYARSMQYESDPMLTDEQTLFAPRATRGPVARVESAQHAARLSDSALARGSFIGRIVSTGSYAPLQLRRGVQYVWADSTASGWRAVIVPENPSDTVRVIKLGVFPHPGPQVPSARWFDTMYGTLPNMRCKLGCCVPCDPPSGISCPDISTWMIDLNRLPEFRERGLLDPRVPTASP